MRARSAPVSSVKEFTQSLRAAAQYMGSIYSHAKPRGQTRRADDVVRLENSIEQDQRSLLPAGITSVSHALQDVDHGGDGVNSTWPHGRV
jgi:hypothetical protein